jgi:hypothetical protein
MLRRLGLVVVLLLLGAQAFRVERTNPPVRADVAAPADVHAILRRACYDCHSHETRWPWYAAVAPASWLVAHDVEEGREELNFSTWDAYAPGKKTKKLKETEEEVAEGDMPPWYYALVHPDAHLSDAERATLRAWTVWERTQLGR